MTRVVGLDLSLTATGIAVAGDVRWNGVMHPPAGLREGPRLAWLRDRIGANLDHGLDMVVIEDLPINAKSAGLTAQLHGVVKLHLHDGGYPPPILVPAATLKVFATGRGNATKIDMVVAARDRLGYDGTDDNAADAMWLAELGCHLLGAPTVTLPLTHTRALDKVRGAA